MPSEPSELTASTSSSDEEGEGEGEEESSRPPLATANTKAGVAWKHQPEGIREDIRHPSLDRKDEMPRFWCGKEHISSPLVLGRARARAPRGEYSRNLTFLKST